MRRLYREKRYECGDYLEVNIYPVFKKQCGRGKKAKPTSKGQEKLNEHNAEQKLIRLLHANFTGEDVEIHLTYRDDALPQSDEDARKDVKNFLRRVKRRREKLGLPELKYISVTEGGGGETRYHHHITLSGGIGRSELEDMWGYGYANSKRLQFGEKGVEGLARYITKQFREKKGGLIFKKRWNASKNLTRPTPRECDGKYSARKVEELATVEKESLATFSALYKGYFCAEAKCFFNEVNAGYYICIKLYRADAGFITKKRRRTK